MASYIIYKETTREAYLSSNSIWQSCIKSLPYRWLNRTNKWPRRKTLPLLLPPQINSNLSRWRLMLHWLNAILSSKMFRGLSRTWTPIIEWLRKLRHRIMLQTVPITWLNCLRKKIKRKKLFSIIRLILKLPSQKNKTKKTGNSSTRLGPLLQLLRPIKIWISTSICLDWSRKRVSKKFLIGK